MYQQLNENIQGDIFFSVTFWIITSLQVVILRVIYGKEDKF